LYNEIYANFGTKVVDIELVPYGNARRSDNGTITCQHGPEECRINAYEGCAIHFIQKPLPLIYCLEKKIMNGATLEKASKDCFEKLKLSHIAYDQVLHCASGKKGRDLQIEAAKRTESAWPAQHQHVPWLFFNNVSLSNSQFLIRDLTMSLCDWYVGDTPPVCAGIGHRTKYHMGNGCQKEF
jgi:interferon gamma-inducible protein 30